jgi:DUF1009 family protein
MLPKLGIIAGGGALPTELVKYCQTIGREFFVLALEGQASSELVKDVPHAWIRLGAAGKAVSILHGEGVKDLILAGSVRRPSFVSLFPDFWTMKFFIKTRAVGLGDDGLLSAIISNLQAQEGFNVVGSDELLPDLLVPVGAIGKLSPDEQAYIDISTGLLAARELGRQDIGQAVVIRDGIIIGREDKKGTDALLKSITPPLSGEPSGVLVKTAKPQQERRADLPTIGPDTLNGVISAGLCGIALEAGSALILNRSAVEDIAGDNGIFVFGATLNEQSPE